MSGLYSGLGREVGWGTFIERFPFASEISQNYCERLISGNLSFIFYNRKYRFPIEEFLILLLTTKLQVFLTSVKWNPDITIRNRSSKKISLYRRIVISKLPI